MKKHRKTWRTAEKIEILSYYNEHGATKASREFDVSSASIFKWKKAFEEHGQAGL
ncbi:MAG: helix-turn-helix domain-containing protein [Pyrinomonadaceae bacterium]